MFRNTLFPKLGSFLIVISLFLFYSCEKEEDVIPDNKPNNEDIINGGEEDGKDDGEDDNKDREPVKAVKEVLTTVNFVYDYNMMRKDLFNEHVGTAHLYVFDKDSVFLFDRSISRNVMTGNAVDFTMAFDTTYLKPGEKYLMTAMAQGNYSGYEWSTIVTPGFQIPIEHYMIPHISKISDYRVVLDRDLDTYSNIGIVNYKDTYCNNKEHMDTLWSTKPGHIQDLQIPYIEFELPEEDMEGEDEDKINYNQNNIPEYLNVTIPMMRITNTITINLVNDSFNQDTDVNDYIFLIDFPNGNGTIGFIGETFPERELIYRSLRKEIKPYQINTNNYTKNEQIATTTRAEQLYAINACFGVSRLQITDGNSLQIRNANDNSIILQINDFSNWLANVFDFNNGQEFLDCEYDFTIDFRLGDDNNLQWYKIGCSSLGWSKIFYNYSF